MNRARRSITSIGLAFLLAACGSGGTGTGTSPQGSGGSTTSGSGGTSTGGSGGTSTSGSGGSSTGGSGGTSTSGSGGSSTSGSGGSATGGSGGSATGGTTTITGRGGAAGGSGGAATGGTIGGSGGNATGGTTTTTGKGGATAGTTGSGGSQTGGTQGTGGTTTSPGTGGSTAAGNTLVTSAKDSYWQTGTLTTVTSGNADVTVNDTSALQSWEGFGGTFNEAGWNVLAMLSASDQSKAINLLFSATDGAGFVFGRVPIGASDYAMSRYTLNDTANDTTMANFSITRDQDKLIPYIKAALAINSKLRLWGSPWTPPAWMKDNNNTDGGNMKDDATVLTAHALYLSKFVEEYGKVGITIEAVHPQNEPGYSTNYPSCLWTTALYNKFIRDYLGPTFASRSVKASIFVGTMSNYDAGKDGTIVTTVTGDSATMKYIKGFGLQWNMLPVVASLKSLNLSIVQSEHKCGNYPWNPGGGLPAFDANKAQNDYDYAVESWGYIRDWIQAGVTVYSAWNMVLDTAGKNIDSVRPWPQNALLTVDTSAKTLTVTPAYYAFRHVSQYVSPGAKVVATAPTTNKDVLAFKNPDGSIVTVLYNSGTSAKTTTLAVGGVKLQFSIPAKGFATVVKR